MNRTVWTLAWLLLSAGLGFGQQTFYFPQIADGSDFAGSNTYWHTTIFLSNQSGSTATGTVTLFQSNGTPMNMGFLDDLNQTASAGNQITFQIPAGHSRKYTSTAFGLLQVGYAVVSSSAPIAGNAIFGHWSFAGLIAEAGVPSASLLIKQAVFADTQFGVNTGVAVANPLSSSVVVNFELINNDGQLVGTATRTLGPRQHLAQFVTELFGTGVGSVSGKLQIYSNTGLLVAMALRFDSRFEKFTTLFPFTVP